MKYVLPTEFDFLFRFVLILVFYFTISGSRFPMLMIRGYNLWDVHIMHIAYKIYHIYWSLENLYFETNWSMLLLVDQRSSRQSLARVQVSFRVLHTVHIIPDGFGCIIRFFTVIRIRIFTRSVITNVSFLIDKR